MQENILPSSGGGHNKQGHQGIWDVIESVDLILPDTTGIKTVPFLLNL